MGPGLVGAGVTQLNLTIDVVIASLLPAGTVSILYYADRVQQLPLGVIGTAVGTAMLPMLSRQVRAGESGAALNTLNRAVEYALFLTLPAAAGLIACAYPIIFVLFGHGAFGDESARLSAQSLAAYAVGLPAFVVVKVLSPAFFARGDTSTPVKVGVGCVAFNLALNLAFMVPLAHIGPALATSMAAIANVCGLGALLYRRGQLVPDVQLWIRLRGMIAATLIMTLMLYGFREIGFGAASRGVLKLVSFTGLIGVGIASYAAAAHYLGAYDLRDFGRLLSRRRSRGARGSAVTPPATTET
jgi:putative peptidoglycan lipid II flippase